MARRNETVFKETGAARVSKSAASALFGDSAGVPRIFVLAAHQHETRRTPEEYRADPRRPLRWSIDRPIIAIADPTIPTLAPPAILAVRAAIRDVR